MMVLKSTTDLLPLRVRSERGVALFLALILISTLSVLSVSLMFLAQSESFSSGNYRLMTQARYGAEAGVQKTADYILNTYSSATAAGFTTTTSPIQYMGNPVVLSSDPSPLHASNYPDAATIAAFQAATTGSIVAGNSTINYTAYATLIAQDSFTDAYSGTPTIVQTWQITSDATVAGVRKSTVEVSAIIDAPKVPAVSFGAFSTDPGCGSLNFVGNVKTNSYNPNTLGGHAPTYCPSGPSPGTGCMDNSGGDVGTNGNLTISGHVDVMGNLSSPITGIGACTNNGGVASVALTASGAATVQGGAPLELPQTVQLPTPAIPMPTAKAPVSLTTGGTQAATCAALGATPGTQCFVSGDTITLMNLPGVGGLIPTLPSITLGSHVNIVLTASPNPALNSYDISSLTLSGQSSIAVSTPSPSYGVHLNFSGLNPDGTPVSGNVIDFQGGAGASDATFGAVIGCATCSIYDAKLLQFIYGGTGNISMVGNSAAAATFYAPKATATMSGTSDLYGAIIAKTLNINGGGGGPNGMSINYDQSLSGSGFAAGTPMVSSFSWKKY